MAFISVREYEVKVRIEDLEAVERRLSECGWVLEDAVLEEDRYVDLTHCVGSPARQVALRIRVRRSLTREAVSSELTFKGRVIVEGVKAREELTTVLNDPEAVTRMFVLAGFPVIMISKKRKVYTNKDFSAKIYLDEVESLGNFIEVELINPTSRDEYLSTLDRIKESLGLSSEENIVKSYLELRMEGWKS
ncbi:MAG: class IV adenylate cyclase [Zestosphaera sp.]